MKKFNINNILPIKIISLFMTGLISFSSIATEFKHNSSFGINEEFPPHGGGGHSHIYEVNTRYNLYNICKNDIEGFSEKVSGRDYTYQSIREDVNKALISRASDGKLAFELLTSKVPDNYTEKNVSFFFYSNIDLNIREPFDLLINDNLAITFIANDDGTLKTLNNPTNSLVEYILVKRDLNKDGVGAFRLTIPTMLVGKGKQAKLKIVGQKKGSRSWFMIFKTDDVIKRLNISALNEAAFSIKQNSNVLHIDAPAHFGGRSYILRVMVKRVKKSFLMSKEGWPKQP